MSLSEWIANIAGGLLPLLLLPLSYWGMLCFPCVLFIGLGWLLKRRLGGYTGDCCGALFLLCELVQYVKMNGESKITEKHISSRALGIQPFSTETEAAFMKNLTHALENIWLTRNKYTIHKEVAISQVFRDNVTYDNLFYMGRFDFVVYEKRGKSELPVFAIELDGKEHFEDEVVRERDRQKNEICKAHHMQIIRVENSYARRYHYIKEILNDYFAKAR
jgi:hypothetical protein